MKRSLAAAAVITGLVFAATVSLAALDCDAGGGICTYTGTVEQSYARSDDHLILICFDQDYGTAPITPLYPEVTKGNAAAFLLNGNPEFGKILHSSALTAQLTGKTVTMNLQGTVDGGSGVWLKIVEFWVNGD
jgi:hypothetical protein